MKVLVEIKDEKAEFVMELLNSLSFVKTKKVEEPSAYKKKVLGDFRAAVKEVNQIKAGKKKGISAKKLLDEL